MSRCTRGGPDPRPSCAREAAERGIVTPEAVRDWLLGAFEVTRVDVGLPPATADVVEHSDRLVLRCRGTRSIGLLRGEHCEREAGHRGAHFAGGENW